MKYTYAYKTSDGVRHEDSIEAASREAVFEALRAKGIRPIKVVAADGSKANGEVNGIRKRVLVLSVVGAALLAGLLSFFAPRTSRLALPSHSPRRQPIGDIAVIEKGALTGWPDIFPEEGERFLAGFAVPGVPVSVRNTTQGEIEAALKRKILPEESDSLEARQIKAMVEGMKDELREFIAAGGTIVEYGNRLVARQEEEIAIYNQAKAAVDEAKASGIPKSELIAIWDKQNGILRKRGIKLITFPSE